MRSKVVGIVKKQSCRGELGNSNPGGLTQWFSGREPTGHCRELGSIPGPGRFHLPRSEEAPAPRRLRAPEPGLLSEARSCASQLERSPHSPYLQKARGQQPKTQAVKNKLAKKIQQLGFKSQNQTVRRPHLLSSLEESSMAS